MNKILKTTLIGVAIYGGCNLMFDLGKGHMLGTLAKYDVTANETMNWLSSDKRLRLQLISKTATLFRRDRSR